MCINDSRLRQTEQHYIWEEVQGRETFPLSGAICRSFLFDKRVEQVGFGQVDEKEVVGLSGKGLKMGEWREWVRVGADW